MDDTEFLEPIPLLLGNLAIRRFRSLYDVPLVPIQLTMTVLTGENDGGKSTCLDAVDFLLGTYTVDGEDYCKDSESDEAIEVEGVFYALDDVAQTTPIHVRARQQHSSPRVCEILDRVHRGFQAHPAQMSLNDLRARMAELSISSPGGNTKAPIQTAAETWIASRPDCEFVDQWRPLAKGDVNRLPKLTRFASADAENPASMIQRVIAREARRLVSDSSHAAELGRIANALDDDLAPSLQRVRERIQQHCPDLDSVEIKATFDFARTTPQVQLRVGRNGKDFDLRKVGQGRLRRVTLAIHEANLRAMEEEAAATTEIFAYDEADTHLDYAAQRLLFDILERQSQISHVQVLAATHSKNFIDMAPLQSILHFRLIDDTSTDVDSLLSDTHEDELAFQASVCAGLGLRNSMLLDERCFLVVEGETEEGAIPILFQAVIGRSLVASGVHLVNTRGSGSARSVVTMLKKKWGREVVLLLDTDSRDRDSKWLSELELAEGKSAHFIGSTEFEDAFDTSVWLQALQRHFKPVQGGDSWTETDIEGLRGGAKFSEALHSEVCRRCKNHEISKPDLGRALASVCDSERHVPEILRECFRAASTAARSATPFTTNTLDDE